jgi:hypothetical protein
VKTVNSWDFMHLMRSLVHRRFELLELIKVNQCAD